ncbi:unnamed protein product [Cuscuta campestris]|uniref:RING-type domain-containing protein n=1 Tax=Cuscuta campestris TaxID=132261 RepID=A0A484L015_9ASTE|nr:unnamed protein product [Cuscuta campestris]
MSAVTTHQTRTLLDVIKDEPNGGKDNQKTWKHFKEKLRLKRDVDGAAWTSTVPVPASDVPINPTNSRSMTRRLSSRFPSSNHGADAEYPADEYKPEFSASRRDLRSGSSRMLHKNPSQAAAERSLRLQNSMSIRRSIGGGDEETGGGGEEEKSAEEEEEEGGGGEQPVRMSLMALLAESEGGYAMDEEEEEDYGESCDDYGGGEFHNCCVCMVRHKGELFEPCGHTFCRLCSRELWAEKGNCPLCNNFILEILDIF